MANEITISQTIRWARNSASLQVTGSESIDQTGTTAIENVQTIGTSSEQITFGDVTDAGQIVFKNMTSVATGHKIHVGTVTPATSSTSEYTLEPLQTLILRPNTTLAMNWYAISEVASGNLLVVAIQR